MAPQKALKKDSAAAPLPHHAPGLQHGCAWRPARAAPHEGGGNAPNELFWGTESFLRSPCFTDIFPGGPHIVQPAMAALAFPMILAHCTQHGWPWGWRALPSNCSGGHLGATSWMPWGWAPFRAAGLCWEPWIMRKWKPPQLHTLCFLQTG